MDNTPVSAHSPGRRDVAAMAARAPAMPVPPPEKLWRNTPYYLVDDGDLRHAIGWQDSKKGPCFVVARRGFMTDKVLDRFPLTSDGWAQAWATLSGLDAQAAQAVASKLDENAGQAGEMERQAQLYQTFADAGRTTVFRWLGIQVLAGNDAVYTIGIHSAAARTNASRLLGPLAGAQAMVTDGSQAWSPGRAMFLPIALTGLATKTMADAAVVFPDGTVRLTALDGNAAVREAQKQIVQFNALASAADTAPAAPETPIDPAIRLRKLHELLDAGLLTQEEYEAKRTQIINSI